MPDKRKYIREYMRKYRKKPCNIKYQKEYQKKYRVVNADRKSETSNEFRKEHLDYYLELSKNNQKNNPVKYKARQLFYRFVKKGIIEKEPCVVCGEKAEAHHLDYNDPFLVIWMCHKHNMRAHKTDLKPNLAI